MPQQAQQLEQAIGYTFRDPGLLRQALTHRSHSGEHGSAVDNERLEFLGDTVLELCVSEALMELFPDYTEGRLTKIRALLVGADNLRREAESLGLGDHLLLGKAEENSGGREKRSTLANALEAIIAAIYLDGGPEAARRFVTKEIASPEQIDAAEMSLDDSNPKSVLQELLHSRGLSPPRYRTVQEEGPPHDRTFTVTVQVEGVGQASGRGQSKRAAEQSAAAQALRASALREPATES